MYHFSRIPTQCSSPPHPLSSWLKKQPAEKENAKHAIADFCENEGLNEPNFSDLTRVEFAYSTTEDDEHEIQVYANLLRNEISYEVDGNIVHIDYFQDNHELAAQGIENSAFSDFINTAEAEFEKHHPTTRKVEKITCNYRQHGLSGRCQTLYRGGNRQRKHSSAG